MTGVCVKCKKDPPCIDIKFALYCSPCFQEATYHKYRTLLARSRDDSADRNASSRGLIFLPRNFSSYTQVYLASRVLIHFSQLPGIQEPARKNLIKYDLAIPSESKENVQLDHFIKMIKNEYPMLGDIHLLNIDEDCSNISISATSKEDLLNAQLLHSQLELMSRLGIERALCPDTSTSLASYILSCTCKGRGKFIPFDSALVRSYPENKFVCRPLKEISDREIELYCQETNVLSSLPLKSKVSNSSIDELTVNFLTNLEAENPGTSNVVIRTSSKVTTSTTSSDGTFRCEICLVPMNEDVSTCRPCESFKEHFIIKEKK